MNYHGTIVRTRVEAQSMNEHSWIDKGSVGKIVIVKERTVVVMIGHMLAEYLHDDVVVIPPEIDREVPEGLEH